MFFEQIVGLSQIDLRVENTLIYEDIKEGYYEIDDVYKNMIIEIKAMFLKTKKNLLCVNGILTIASLIILVILEVYQNKFKREYYRFLKIINVIA